MNLVGDASARPLLDTLAGHARPLGHLVAAPARLGRQHPLGRRQGGAARPRSRRCSRSSRASARRSRPRRRSRSRRAPASPPRPRRSPSRRRPRRSWSTTTCGRSRGDRGSSGGSRRGAASRSATTRIPSAARARSWRSTVRAGRCPATWRPSTPTARCTCSGRGSLCINTGGEKVYPEEVEAVLKGHPAVADAVVVGAPDDRLGQRVVAVVAAASGADAPDLEALQEHCRAHLAGYKVPRAVARRRRGGAHRRGQGRLRVGARRRDTLNDGPARQRGRGSAFCNDAITAGPIGSGAHPCVVPHTKSNWGCAAL